jgi:hypothetical protein
LDIIDDPSELSAKCEFDRYKAVSKSFLVGSPIGNLLILTIDLSYLTIKFPKDDVLTIWKHLKGEYPYIVAIARDILGIPSTGVGIERVFSIARH